MVYSDQDPFNHKPVFVRVEAEDDESVIETLDRYNIDPHEIFYVFEGYCNTEDEEDSQSIRVQNAIHTIKDAVQRDPQYAWKWHTAITTALVDAHINADTAYTASVLMMRRGFNTTPLEPRWFSVDELPNVSCNKYEVIVAHVSDDGKIADVIVEALYSKDRGWKIVDPEYAGCEVVLWRFLPFS